MAGAGFEAPLCLRKDGVRLSFLSLFVPRQTGQAQARDISCGLMKRRTPCLAQGVPRMLGASTLDAPLYIHIDIHMHTHIFWRGLLSSLSCWSVVGGLGQLCSCCTQHSQGLPILG